MSTPLGRLQVAIKRVLDIGLAALLLVLLSPLLALIAVAVRATSRGPALFRQPRLGLRGSTFSICKFRTMVLDAEKLGTGLYVQEQDPRITGVGRWLRKTHLDELPQLWNIVRGEMSFVGPRPTVPYHYDYYEEWEKQRVELLPGITGWAQVNGANRIDWDTRIKLDVWYVQHWSLLLDLRIVIRTVLHLLLRVLGKKRDAYSHQGPVWKRPRPDDIDTPRAPEKS